MFIIILVLALIVLSFLIEKRGMGKGWKIIDPAKKGGSFSLFFKDKHIANVRGKTKAMVLESAINGKNMTKDLDMPVKATVKPVAKKVATKKVVAKKPVAKKVVAKTTKKVAAKKVTKK